MDETLEKVGAWFSESAKTVESWLSPAKPPSPAGKPKPDWLVEKSSDWQQTRVPSVDPVPHRGPPDLSQMPEPVYASAKNLPRPAPTVQPQPKAAVSPPPGALDHDFVNAKNYRIGSMNGAADRFPNPYGALQKPADEPWNKEAPAPAVAHVEPVKAQPLPKLGRGADKEVAELQQNLKRYGEATHQKMPLGRFGERHDGVDGMRGKKTIAAEKEAAKALGLDPEKHSVAELNGKLKERIDGIEHTTIAHDATSADPLRKLAKRGEMPSGVSGGQTVGSESKSPTAGGGKQATNAPPLHR